MTYYLDIAYNSCNLDEAIQSYKHAESIKEQENALTAVGEAFVGTCGAVVRKIPMVGYLYTILLGELETAYTKLADKIQSRTAQIVFTEIVCDYYQYSWSLDRLKTEVRDNLNVDKLSNELADQLYSIIAMEEALSEEAQSNADILIGLDGKYGSYTYENTFGDMLKEYKNNAYNSMTPKEREEYEKEWTNDTTNGSKKNAQNNANKSTKEPAPKDPLIIDLGKKGIELTSLDDGVHFDLDKNGFAEKTAWIGNEDGFLALDRNGNGKIDNGGELFGDQVTLKDGSTSSEGFEALAELDENDDGVIDKNDPEFANLRVWIDANHNGVSESDELKTLDELGITSISLDHANKSETDSSTGTIVSESSTVTFADGGKIHFYYDDEEDGYFLCNGYWQVNIRGITVKTLLDFIYQTR